jgi:hypothetical protein
MRSQERNDCWKWGHKRTYLRYKKGFAQRFAHFSTLYVGVVQTVQTVQTV